MADRRMHATGGCRVPGPRRYPRDRPVCDALGYLHAALELSSREIPVRRLEALSTIVEAHTPDYGILIATQLDLSIPLGPGRDKDPELRRLAAEHIEALTTKIAPSAPRMRPDNRHEILERTVENVTALLADARP
ncbi:hypothetical protein [Bradyrhizobium ganzhouense]|uniref:hypothetical protein n=1 Tax=Bradyrhizobium ganzhouense TaxID=1179767 RepID=UPI003CF9A8E3